MSDVNEKITLSVDVEGTIAKVSRSDKPQFMLNGEYDMNTMFGACALLAHFAKELASDFQSPEQMIDSMAGLARTLL